MVSWEEFTCCHLFLWEKERMSALEVSSVGSIPGGIVIHQRGGLRRKSGSTFRRGRVVNLVPPISDCRRSVETDVKIPETSPGVSTSVHLPTNYDLTMEEEFFQGSHLLFYGPHHYFHLGP
jgi:hypothetical protein